MLRSDLSRPCRSTVVGQIALSRSPSVSTVVAFPPAGSGNIMSVPRLSQMWNQACKIHMARRGRRPGTQPFIMRTSRTGRVIPVRQGAAPTQRGGPNYQLRKDRYLGPECQAESAERLLASARRSQEPLQGGLSPHVALLISIKQLRYSFRWRRRSDGLGGSCVSWILSYGKMICRLW